MATTFATTFMRKQWKIINEDKILSENEVHNLIKAVEGYLERPGSEPVRQVIQDYDSFVRYVRDAAGRGIFPTMWTQYLQSAKVGFLRYPSYRETLPKGTAVPTLPPAKTGGQAKPAPRPPFPRCCQTELLRIRKLLKVLAVIDVVTITSDVNSFSKGTAKAITKGKLRDPNVVVSGWALKNTEIGSLIPIAANQAQLHALLHDEDDAYLQAWWNKLGDSLRGAR